jgi:hypothetical protein
MVLMAAGAPEQQVHYFPSVMYGQILTGSAPSRYETTLILKSRKSTRAHIEVFSDKSEPMEASFADADGHIATTSASFAFLLEPERTVRVKLGLPESEASHEIAVHTGWATVTSLEEVEVSALVRITGADGKVLTRSFVFAERPTRS